MAFNFSITVACLAATSAGAFSVSSAVSTPCHEPITMEALRNTRVHHAGAAPLGSANRNDLAIANDLPFKVFDDMRDLGAVALLIGVRDNDLKGRDPNELDALALIHGDPENQREHCLRAPGHDEPEGTELALAACKGFIRERFADAMGGLDENGLPSLERRMSTAVGLSLRGKVTVQLPLFYVRMGQAMHALQDGFTHTYRAAERNRVSVILNYIDVLEKDYAPERDGPRHSMDLDKCDATDTLRSRNRELAVEASTRLLSIAVEAGRTPEQKLDTLDAMLEEYFGHAPGCTDQNKWCDAAERGITSAGGCGYSEGAGAASLLLGALVLLFATRRSRRARAGATMILLLALVLPVTAQAQTTPAPALEVVPFPKPPTPPAAPTAVPATAPPVHSDKAAEVGTVVPITPGEVQAVQNEAQLRKSVFSIYVAGAGSIYNPAVAAILGVRLRLNDYWQLGVDGEINGWYGIHARKLRTGATNVYASITLRYPLKFERVSLRSTLQLGAAVQMLDLAGVPAGTVGIFGGLNPLGVEIKLSGHLFLVFYPLGIALPVTQLEGAPFAFPQFRSTLGLEIAF